MSRTQERPLIAPDHPIVVTASSATCSSSSTPMPSPSARRACEWVAPSESAAMAYARCTRRRVRSSSGPARLASSPNRWKASHSAGRSRATLFAVPGSATSGASVSRESRSSLLMVFSGRLPKRSCETFAERAEHHVEADTDSLRLARVGIDRMLEPRRKHEQRALVHPQDDLVCVRAGECGDRWSDDAGLAARIVEVDRVGPGAGPQVVDAAQKVVGMVVELVCRTSGEHGRPAGRELDGVVADVQELEDSSRRVPCAGDELPEVLELVQRLHRLPALAALERRQIAPQARERRNTLRLDRFAYGIVELHPPHERREHRDHVTGHEVLRGGVASRTAFPDHPGKSSLPGATGINRSDGLQLGLALGSPGGLALRLRAIGLAARRLALALGGAFNALALLLRRQSANEQFLVAHGRPPY